MYAIIRSDLEMTPGKLSAQAGHAYTESLFDCLDKNPEIALSYRTNGSKVTLKAKNLNSLKRAECEAALAGIPHALFEDSGHIMLPHFDGSPVITALGIGPCTKSEAREIVKRFSCVS